MTLEEIQQSIDTLTSEVESFVRSDESEALKTMSLRRVFGNLKAAGTNLKKYRESRHRQLTSKNGDVIAGYLEVGLTEKGDEVVINHPDLRPDADGVGHIVFSPQQALNLARLLTKKANEASV